MFNLLAAENVGNLILIIILLVACGGMFILSYLKNKKYQSQQQEMQNNIEVGSKVLTKTFIYGTIEKITETTDGKVVLLKTGEGDKVSYFEMNMDAIYALDNKEEVVEEVLSEEVEENSEEAEVAFQESETVEAEVVEEKPKTKKTSKKKAE